ncbi:cupin 2 protein [Fadolivirus algeromassiliense]|jgi:mannose-6-phosphate isomerase-like protein (cupin superfamily)|uniref:Cupin 2 protein n=1 Tax=Fadolivirus FV1/VV64 TaxID=3070911 RepID=A0A7D3QVL3_9VIRU|nr:cupin 2 protein [Fadolivirus algeromassiliense]QKF93886.1 cupin 2 protein [Fadolivirus FV1/VV64]
MQPEILKPIKIQKGWGYEIWMVNNNKYCGKILHFNENSKFSMHYHLLKDESWYVKSGTFILRWIDTSNANIVEQEIKENDSIRIPQGMPHQLETITGGEIIEISTQHFDYDSYRIMKGDGQK